MKEPRGHYIDRMRKLLKNEQHADLRTIFDNVSHEWSYTTMDEKVEILRKMVNSGEHLFVLLQEYQLFYSEKQRNDIANIVDQSLADIITHMLSESSRDFVRFNPK